MPQRRRRYCCSAGVDGEWRNSFLRAMCTSFPRLLSASPEDGKSELLQTRLFVLLAGELYRCHAGCLFGYANGAWSPVPGVTPEALEFLLVALRRAQAYFSILSPMKPKRSFGDLVWELRVLEQVGEDDAVMGWQLQEIIPKKADVRAADWLHGLAELCRTLRFNVAEHHRTVNLCFARFYA